MLMTLALEAKLLNMLQMWPLLIMLERVRFLTRDPHLFHTKLTTICKVYL